MMPAAPIMPDFCQGTHGFHHTLDSSLEILAAMGISSSRISIQMAGPGWPAYWVVAQSPSPGAHLTADLAVSLSIAGPSVFYSLPAGMWDTGGELELGTREILELFDDPLEKASHWIREGARLLDVSRNNLPACARWVKLFGVDAEVWPKNQWYALALLVPNLHRLAGKEAGIRLALRTLLGLPLMEIRGSREFTWLPESELSRLSAQANRLGRDSILGDRIEDLECLTLIIGPVSLATYSNFQTSEKQSELDSVLALCAPCYHKLRIQWTVDYQDRSPRLGLEQENGRLGINSRMGQLHQRTPVRPEGAA
jgi:hypothetical protein